MKRLNSACSTLHLDGYEVHKEVFSVTTEVVDYARKTALDRGQVIFNHNENANNDCLRKQCRVRHDNKRLQSVVFDPVISLLKERGLLRQHTPTSWVIIHSLVGCQAQAAHCDYEVDDEMMRRADEDQVPLAVLVCLMPGTKLHVWPGSHQTMRKQAGKAIKKRTLELNSGDVLIFRGDLVHAGAAYLSEDNVRLHCFLDSFLVPRSSNRTYLVAERATQNVLNSLGIQ